MNMSTKGWVIDKTAVIGSACSMHKPKQLGYLQWHDWAEKMTRQGKEQTQCSKCGRWYFREEF
jgi:hypothetical protein